MTAWVEWTEGVGPVGVRYTPMPVTTSIPSQPAVIGNNRRLVCPLSARRWVVRLEDGACAAAIGTGNAPPAEPPRPRRASTRSRRSCCPCSGGRRSGGSAMAGASGSGHGSGHPSVAAPARFAHTPIGSRGLAQSKNSRRIRVRLRPPPVQRALPPPSGRPRRAPAGRPGSAPRRHPARG